jgi:isoleucyl-tRNA synthetase
LRKAIGRQVRDRILLHLTIPPEQLDAFEPHREMVARETLAVGLEVVAGPVPPGAVALVAVMVASDDVVAP